MHAFDFPVHIARARYRAYDTDDCLQKCRSAIQQYGGCVATEYDHVQVHVRAQRLCPFAQRPESVALSLIRFKGCHADAFMRFL